MFKRERRNNKGAAGQGKPERISNRLDHRLIAESRQLPKKKKAIILSFAIIVIGSIVGGATLLGRDEPPPPPPKKSDDPFQGQEPDWQPIFHYQPKEQQ